MIKPRDILAFWFGEPPYQARNKLWWRGDPAIDQQIAERFGAAIEHAIGGGFEDWQRTAQTTLALVLLLDQFPRNVFRGTAKAFAGDARAQAVTGLGIDRGDLEELHYLQGVFFCLPLEHAESIKAQDRCVETLTAMRQRHHMDSATVEAIDGYLVHAEQHRQIIRQFGRFPHRNKALGRETTPAEAAWLAGGGSRFGQ